MKSFFYFILMGFIMCTFSSCGRNAPIIKNPNSPSEPELIHSEKGPHDFMFRITNPKSITSRDTGNIYVPFLTTDEIICNASNDEPWALKDIRWTINGNTEWSVSDKTEAQGFDLSFKLVQKTITNYEAQRNKQPLDFTICSILTIRYTLPEDPGTPRIWTHTVSARIIQDNIDDLRQEYIDVYKARGITDGETPGRDKLENQEPVNKELKTGICPKHKWWITSKLDQKVTEIKNGLKDYGIYVAVNCGYRCPVGNALTKSRQGAEKSPHMKGCAFDWDTGNIDPQSSWDLYVIYEYIEAEWEKDKSKPRPVTILYDYSDKLYYSLPGYGSNLIPKDYDANTSEIQFKFGHTDWRRDANW